jgi:hypothetical protein
MQTNWIRLGVALGALVVTAPLRAQTTQDLQRQLQERDAIINDLMRRVDALERQQGRTTAPTIPPSRPAEPPSAAARTPEEETVARALERSLLEQGGQLLAPGTADISPFVQYSHTATNQLGIVTSGAVTSVAPVTARQDTLQYGVTLRYGLPWVSQINLTIPFATTWTDTTVGGVTTSRSETGIGDIDIGLSKQLLFEKGWLPDIIANLDYKTSTGSASFGPSGQIGGTGTGADALSAGFTVVKRQDPLVFLGGLSYTYNFSGTDDGFRVSPGDQIDVRAGTILAASPDTSLRFILDTAFAQKESVNGIRLAGSDRVSSILEIGASSVISASTFIDLGVGIGLTKDAPDFRVILSTPVRF